MTLIARGREFGSWIRNRASARELIRADSLCMGILLLASGPPAGSLRYIASQPLHYRPVPPRLDRNRRHRGTSDERLFRGFFERLIRRQNDGGRTHLLMHGIDSRR